MLQIQLFASSVFKGRLSTIWESVPRLDDLKTIDLKYYKTMSIFIREISRCFLLFSLLFLLDTTSKCLNSSDFKYDLSEVSSVSSSPSLCSQHAPRTCCSKNNLDFVAKKYSIHYRQNRKNTGRISFLFL